MQKEMKKAGGLFSAATLDSAPRYFCAHAAGLSGSYCKQITTAFRQRTVLDRPGILTNAVTGEIAELRRHLEGMMPVYAPSP